MATYGALGAAMAVALYGDVAFRQAEPVFATSILGSLTDDAEPLRVAAICGDRPASLWVPEISRNGR